MAKIEKVKYLIIGNSAGGIGAVEAIREMDKTGSIKIISDEPYPTYSRPLISKYLASKCSLESILFRPSGFYRQNNIHTYLGKTVKRIDIDGHTAELEEGKTIAWRKLLLATGGLPIVPQIKNINQRGVFTFITLDNAKAIDGYLENVSRAVVIGGGLIGVSATEALVKRGIKVTIIEMKDRVLNTILDEQTSAIAEEALMQAKVKVITDHTVNAVTGEKKTRGVVLDSGKDIPCEMVVIAIGVAPRIELAADAGVKINRGIVVDRYMATSCPDVYACGDVAEAYDFIYDSNRLTPIWPNAHVGGRVAGYNMAGVKTEYPGGTAMNSLNYFGLDIASAGMMTPPDENNYEILINQTSSIYRKAIIKDDLLVGIIFAGDIERTGIAFNLMRERINVADFKRELVSSDFGLASLPQDLWQKYLRTSPPKPPSQTATPIETVKSFEGE